MYDYAGEWIYRVGIPAKSGVGGGILAALPARLGLGSYSPRLDDHGNSVRGIKVCEALSSHYDLHMLNRSDDARNSIIADYDIGNSPSRRVRRAREQNILAAHRQDVRIIELVGTLSFSNVDYVSRQIAAKPRPQLVIFDLRRVTAMTRAGTRLLAEEFRDTRAIELQIGPIDAPVLHSPSVVSMGNPHAIFWVDDVNAYDLERFGPLLENHPIFPERANITLAHIVDREHITIRTWERGAGLTRACGSAACATAVAAARLKRTNRTVTITLPGGDLQIEWRERDDHVLMTGTAEFEYEGKFDPALFANVA